MSDKVWKSPLDFSADTSSDSNFPNSFKDNENLYIKVDLKLRDKVIFCLDVLKNFLNDPSIEIKTMPKEKRIDLLKIIFKLEKSILRIKLSFDKEKSVPSATITSEGTNQRKTNTLFRENTDSNDDKFDCSCTGSKNLQNVDKANLQNMILTNLLNFIQPIENAPKTFSDLVEIMFTKINRFDPSKEHIMFWLSKYISYCNQYEWSDERRTAGLAYFIDSGLFQIVTKQTFKDFEQITECLIYHVDLFIRDKASLTKDHVAQMIKIFEQYEFTNVERRYWLSQYLPLDKIKLFFDNLKPENEDDKKLFQQINLLIFD